MHPFDRGSRRYMAWHYEKKKYPRDQKPKAKNGRLDKKDYLGEPFYDAYKFKWTFTPTCYPI